jgi:WD repeat-containing protein 81
MKIIITTDLYGDSFVERQYIPYCVDILKSVTTHKISQTSESALIGVAAVLERIFRYIPETLMSVLQDSIIKDILSPIVELICSNSVEFPTGGISRALLASKVSKVYFIFESSTSNCFYSVWQ